VAGSATGIAKRMPTPRSQDDADDARVSSRSELLPEEEAAGSDDPAGQAAAILEDSDQRIADRDAAPSATVEKRSSEEVTDEP
jgi:hypothetical protein